MPSSKRPLSCWVIVGFLSISLFLILLGQTLAIFNYELTVTLGLQDTVEDVSEIGVQVNRAFGVADTLIYIPLMAASLVGLVMKRRWSLITTGAVMGISAYWATTAAFMLLFLRGVPNWNLEPGPAYWGFVVAYIVVGGWGVGFLIFRGERLIA